MILWDRIKHTTDSALLRMDMEKGTFSVFSGVYPTKKINKQGLGPSWACTAIPACELGVTGTQNKGSGLT